MHQQNIIHVILNSLYSSFCISDLQMINADTRINLSTGDSKNTQIQQQKQDWQSYLAQIHKIYRTQIFHPNHNSSFSNDQNQLTGLYSMYHNQMKIKAQLCDKNSIDVNRFVLKGRNSENFKEQRFRGLCQTQWLNIHTLAIENLPQMDKCFVYLSQVHWPNIARLSLQSNDITGDKKTQFKKCLMNFPKLKQLNLNNNKLSREGIQAITALSNFDSLEILNLNNNNVEKSGISTLMMKDVSWHKLKMLSLKNNNIGYHGIVELFKNTSWQLNIKHLMLTGNKIGDMGIQVISNKSQLTQLNELFMEDCGLTKDSLIHLKRCHISQIYCLELANNYLSKLEGMSMLSVLDIGPRNKNTLMVQLKQFRNCQRLYL